MATGAAILTSALGPIPSAQAYRVFFGEDPNNSATSPLLSTPNANSAEASFLSNLIGVGTETFEGLPNGAGGPLSLTFPGAGTATLTGPGRISAVTSGQTNGTGRYAISGQKFWEVSANGMFTVNFSDPVAAFGFYGVDLGDFGGQLVLNLSGGQTQSVMVPNTVGRSGSTDGSVLFFGLIAESIQETFSSISFAMTIGQGDVFAFDNMTVGSLKQVKPPTESTPEPIALTGLLVIGVLGARSLRQRA
ncbi:MAG: PEP-CTERM sorting domain-containing protein [Oscillatoriales cyanobacterium]|nr:MAG: PEP-CTERM sorting domain-containing protein [Oscillatoriales cyanobacterium]